MNKSGFTLLELLLSIAIISIIAGAGAPIYANLQTRSDLSTAAQIVAQSARRAQTRAWANDGDSAWGINIAAGVVTIYQGSSYLARNTAWDETLSISSSIQLSGDLDYNYSQIFGLPDAAGSLTLISLDGKVMTVDIGADGQISY